MRVGCLEKRLPTPFLFAAAGRAGVGHGTAAPSALAGRAVPPADLPLQLPMLGHDTTRSSAGQL